MKKWKIELKKNGRIIYRNYITTALIETAILAAAAVAMKNNVHCTAIVTDGQITYENDY